MVNTLVNVSAYQGLPPLEEGASNRVISPGPLYAKNEILNVLAMGEDSLLPWTRGCREDMQRLAMEIPDAINLVREALTSGSYLKSEWCVQKPTGPWAACDVYRLFRYEAIKNSQNEMRFEYYVKFAIGKTGKLLLLVSCHLSRDSR